MTEKKVTNKIIRNKINITKFYFICNYFFSPFTLFPIAKKLIHIIWNKIKEES